MVSDDFKSRIEASLYGMAIGILAGRQQLINGQANSYNFTQPGKNIETEPVIDDKIKSDNVVVVSFAFINSIVKAYVQKRSRIIPEEWGEILKDDEIMSTHPDFEFMNLNTVRELLKEGMNARLTGLGNVPSANVCLPMIITGIYHAGDPDMAFVDGFELSSVITRSPGAEWGAMTAAAVAASLKPGANIGSVINALETVLVNRSREYYGEPLRRIMQASTCKDREEFLSKMMTYLIREGNLPTAKYLSFDPVSRVIPILNFFGDDFKKAITLSCFLVDALSSDVNPPVLGAIFGALSGIDSIPGEWRKKVSSVVEPLKGIIPVVDERLNKERNIIEVTGQLVKEGKKESSIFFDKIYGSLLGSAIGNAMGSVVESMLYTDIDARYPSHITAPLDPSRLEKEDDNQMAMLLYETYLEKKGDQVTAFDFANTWKERLNYHQFFFCMRNSYELIRDGFNPRIAGHWNLVTGSTVMCMEAVGMFYPGDSENAFIDAMMISYMYQRGLDVLMAAILSAAVADAMRPDATVDSVIQTALKFAPRTPLITFDRRKFKSVYDYLSCCVEIGSKYDDVYEVRKELYDKCLLYDMIDPLELFGFTLAMLKVARGDVRLAAIGGTNIGRDSDTIAGRGAMLSGAINGAAGVPGEWMEMFSRKSMDRILQTAHSFTNLIIENKLPQIKERQAFLK